MTNRTNFVQLIEQSYFLYRDNFSIFFQLSAAQALLGLIAGQLATVLGEELIIVAFIVALVLMYFQMRLAVALVLLVLDRNENKTANITEYYTKSKEKIWPYIGATLLLGLIVAVPISIFLFVFLMSDNIITQALVVLLGSGLGLFLLMHYFLAPYIVLLDSQSKAALKESFNYVKPVRNLAALVVLTSFLLLGAPYLLFKFLDIQGIISDLTGSLLQAILAPLNLCIVLLFYINISNQSTQELID